MWQATMAVLKVRVLGVLLMLSLGSSIVLWWVTPPVHHSQGKRVVVLYVLCLICNPQLYLERKHELYTAIHSNISTLMNLQLCRKIFIEIFGILSVEFIDKRHFNTHQLINSCSISNIEGVFYKKLNINTN